MKLSKEDLENVNALKARCNRYYHQWQQLQTSLQHGLVVGSGTEEQAHRWKMVIGGMDSSVNQEMVNQARMRYEQEKETLLGIETKVEQISNITVSEAIYYYYIVGCTWGETATEIGYKNSEDRLRRLVNQHLS